MLGEVLTLDDIDLRGRTVIVRVDINAPVNPTDGSFLDISRFRGSLPTLRELAGSKVVVLAHQSRPGKADFMTTREHARVMGRLLSRPVKYVDDLIGSRAQREIRRALPTHGQGLNSGHYETVVFFSLKRPTGSSKTPLTK